MNIVQITPGAGGMYCGNCFRDNALVGALRKLGHQTLLVPLYLPMTLDEPDQSRGTPVFFSGINVYLEQKSALFRRAPRWVRRLLASGPLLKLAARRAARTRAGEVGELTLSMLRGEEGNQACELETLLAWLETRAKPDIVNLSNALLIGLARQLKRRLGMPVVCSLQGEDTFLDALPGEFRSAAWNILAERAREVDCFIAPSRYFAELMTRRLGLSPERVRVVPNGINLAGFVPREAPPEPPVLGYFARLCREKGLDTLVEAYRLLRRRGRVPHLKLRLGGGCGPADEPVVAEAREKLRAAGLLADAEFCPNLDRAGKLEFYRSLSVFSVPARYGEAFGMYVLEALAAGVPVVQPETAAFPELVRATGGGLLCRPNDPAALAEGIEALLLDPAKPRQLGACGREAVLSHYSQERMAERIVEVYRGLAPAPGCSPGQDRVDLRGLARIS